MFIHTQDVPWRKPRDLRDGQIHFKDLLEGSAGRVDNFHLSLVRTGADYQTPRHRHNFDQVRVLLEGELHYGRNFGLKAGEIGYFPEGAPYGPTSGRGDALWLLLQFGSCSLSGYATQAELFRAMDVLGRTGTFASGVYTRIRADGAKENQDAYEAAWESHRGRPLEYPRARYPSPVAMAPEAFDWKSSNETGTRHKPLLRVTERDIQIELLEIAANAECCVRADDQPIVGYCLEGHGHAAGGGTWRAGSAFKVERETQHVFSALGRANLLLVTLPRFTAEELQKEFDRMESSA